MNTGKMGLTIEEAAACTGIGRNTMRKLVDWGKLPVLKVGRKAIIRRDTLERFMAVNQGRDLLRENDVRRVRGSRERFIRQCISGAVIREAPSVDVPKLICEVRRGGQPQPHPHRRQRQGAAGSAGTPQGIRAEPGSGRTYRGRLHEGLTAKRTAQL